MTKAKWTGLGLGAAMLVSTSAAIAADLARAPSGYCPRWGESQLATLPNIADIQREVQARYERADEESEADRTVYNRSPRFIWAVQARGACGIALGYLAHGEVNSERLWNCECYYTRMTQYFGKHSAY